MTTCEANSHRLEFQNEKQGIITWLCKDCGETITQYQDLGSGG